MRFGVRVCPLENFADIRRLVALAQAAEFAGWDAFFLWDPIACGDLNHPMVDPWVALAAIAVTTQRIRIGTIETPVAQRRHWKLARETVSLDHLSQGRLILGVGLGAPELREGPTFGEEPEQDLPAQQLEEGLKILIGLWRGEEFAYSGKHYRLPPIRLLPKPVQEPRIPIWVGGRSPEEALLRRAAQYEGVVAPGGPDTPLTPDDWRHLLSHIRQYRPENHSFDAVAAGMTPADVPDRAATIVADYIAAGCTWWLEDVSPFRYGMALGAAPWTPGLVAQLESRIRQGPPRP